MHSAALGSERQRPRPAVPRGVVRQARGHAAVAVAPSLAHAGVSQEGVSAFAPRVQARRGGPPSAVGPPDWG
eukprot:760290-Lingulodinium_polyedra.AAC.1